MFWHLYPCCQLQFRYEGGKNRLTIEKLQHGYMIAESGKGFTGIICFPAALLTDYCILGWEYWEFMLSHEIVAGLDLTLNYLKTIFLTVLVHRLLSID